MSLPKRDVPLLRLDPPNQNHMRAAPARSRNSARVLAGYSLNQPRLALRRKHPHAVPVIAARDRPPDRVILVTSALQGEGKSTVAANLGRTAATAGTTSVDRC